MNILMALSQLEVTGAEVYGVTLSDELIKRGNKVIIVSDTLTKKTQAKYIKLEFNKRGLSQRVKQVQTLLKIIKDNDIQVVHAHSRASSWSCEIACKIAGIPLITTVHGRQPVHLSRKIFKAFGDKSLTVCENIKKHLIDELGVKSSKIEILRNPIETAKYPFNYCDTFEKEERTVSIIGRLSGPKGEVAFKALEILQDIPNITTQVIGGKDIPKKFQKFLNNDRIKFLGYVDDIPEKIKDSDIVIGAGRVGVESILSGKPLIAIGEAQYVGLVKEDNISQALESNFGDINFKNISEFHWDKLKKDIEDSVLLSKEQLLSLRDSIISEFDLNTIIDRIEKLYAKTYVIRKKYEIPVVMYHRVIRDKSEGGVHGIYVTESDFEKQLQYLKDNNYEVITFKDLLGNRYKERFNSGKKQIILTFDDGYVDNYKYAFPLLKKYGFRCVIYLLSDLDYNRWDVDVKDNPEHRFELMNLEMIKEMDKYGIEFGGHTKTHPKLATIPIETAQVEIFESKEILEKRLGHKLISFAYPYGNLNKEVKEIVKNAGYEFAVATDSGDISFSEDLFQIRRIGFFSTNNFFTFKRKVSGRYNFIKIKREEKEKRKKI
ncbi:polysaccharide deacetylase family protein [Fusobacterium sp.]|uniref:polysaccharide deacetylase family protein n=1 Tax=Fusobacterium sp. TaxID=68766 RepID=UPI0026384D8A|nr:polysaccharide deacetylase family protein [Fusobacterium sp.]